MKRVRLIGLVTSVRHVQTKTGKMMAIALCDSFDFKFTVLVFSKDYETLSPLLEVDKILLVEGPFRGNEENGEMSVTAQTIRASTITSIRQQAMDMNLFNAKDIVNLTGYTETVEPTEVAEVKKENEIKLEEPTINMEEESEEMDEEEITDVPEKKEIIEPKEYILTIPQTANKQDLLDLKAYLADVPKGALQVFLDIRGQKIDTKTSIGSPEILTTWIATRNW